MHPILHPKKIELRLRELLSEANISDPQCGGISQFADLAAHAEPFQEYILTEHLGLGVAVCNPPLANILGLHLCRICFSSLVYRLVHPDDCAKLYTTSNSALMSGKGDTDRISRGMSLRISTSPTVYERFWVHTSYIRCDGSYPDCPKSPDLPKCLFAVSHLWREECRP
jgi:hypothetical protein